MTALESLPSVRASVEALGLRAHKSLGQHFLYDRNLTQKIARAAGAGEGDLVLEVGPGPGGLTRALLQSGAQVVAVERDQRFAPLLHALTEASGGALQVRQQDALDLDLSTLHRPGKLLKIVANLPYNVGTALLVNWLESTPLTWASMTLMFQREVAERVVAQADAPGYGRLAVLRAAVAEAHLLFGVPAAAFTPPPKVDSAVVHLVPKPDEERFDDLEALQTITRAAFGQRRKMLRSSLKACARAAGLDVMTWLQDVGIDPATRPQTVPPEGFFALASAWREAQEVLQ